MGILLRAAINAIAIFVAVYLLQPVISCCDRTYGFGGLDPYVGYLIAGLLLGLLNAFVRPILDMIALPITCLTLGLFHLVINALMLWILSLLPIGFHVNVNNFGDAITLIVGALLISVVSFLLSRVIKT
jgi:putative membrane protein